MKLLTQEIADFKLLQTAAEFLTIYFYSRLFSSTRVENCIPLTISYPYRCSCCFDHVFPWNLLERCYCGANGRSRFCCGAFCPFTTNTKLTRSLRAFATGGAFTSCHESLAKPCIRENLPIYTENSFSPGTTDITSSKVRKSCVSIMFNVRKAPFVMQPYMQKLRATYRETINFHARSIGFFWSEYTDGGKEYYSYSHLSHEIIQNATLKVLVF